MSENDQSKLSPIYTPAEQDSVLEIRFVGNTAQVANARLGGVDPFQMLAAAEWLKMKAFQFIQSSEIESAKREQAEQTANQILTTAKLPPEGFVGPDKLKG